MKLIAVEPGNEYDQIDLILTDHLPDGFRCAVVQVSPASNGDECRPSEYREALMEALRSGISNGVTP